MMDVVNGWLTTTLCNFNEVHRVRTTKLRFRHRAPLYWVEMNWCNEKRPAYNVHTDTHTHSAHERDDCDLHSESALIISYMNECNGKNMDIKCLVSYHNWLHFSSWLITDITYELNYGNMHSWKKKRWHFTCDVHRSRVSRPIFFHT